MGGIYRVGVVLLSGGMDSTVLATYVKRKGYDTYALTINYGQRHRKEIESAKEVARILNIEHKIVKLDIGDILYSALTNTKIEVPKDREFGDIPITYVPFRNTLLAVLGAAYLESILLAKGIEKDVDARVFLAANAIDYSGYPDCRPEFFRALNNVFAVAGKIPISVEAPLLRMTKKDIIKLGIDIGAPLEYTWSCYEGGEYPCGRCDSCRLRAKGFEEAGVEDPLFRKLLVKKAKGI